MAVYSTVEVALSVGADKLELSPVSLRVVPFSAVKVPLAVTSTPARSRVPAVTVKSVQVKAAGRTNIPPAPFIFRSALV